MTSPRPIPSALWAKIQAERARLQAEGFTGRYTVEFDCLDGMERKVRVLAPQVAEVLDTIGARAQNHPERT